MTETSRVSFKRVAADTNVLLSSAQSHLEEAKSLLEKRDPKDVPLLALALKLQIPIWSNDRDFEDLPIELYPTARLLKVMGL